MTSHSTAAPIPIPASTASSSITSPPPVSDAVMTSPTSAHRKATSPPIDPSKLNNQPAPIPAQAEGDSPNNEPRSPVKSPRNSFGSSGGSGSFAGSGSAGENPLADSAYLEQQSEPASHPTIAETGVPASNGDTGPRQGQLKRADKPKGNEGIIKLGSLGGDGLKMKPPVDRE
ncbi:hypothetical protein IAR50_004880 [Cryptococcus sp. DSM 104548]